MYRVGIGKKLSIEVLNNSSNSVPAGLPCTVVILQSLDMIHATSMACSLVKELSVLVFMVQQLVYVLFQINDSVQF